MGNRNYPAYRDYLNDQAKKLRGEIPEVFKGFNSLREAAMAKGELSVKTKELVAIGIAIGARRDGCIAYHVRAALSAGATRNEITETIGVAMLMGGGPSMVYGCEAYAALERFEAEK